MTTLRDTGPVSTDLPATALPRLHDAARWLGTWWYLPFFRVSVHRRERIPARGPVVLVANHSAMVDGPLLFGLLGRRSVFLVKQEMFGGPIGIGLRGIGQIPVHRGRVDRAPLTTALGVLRGGGVVGVFPEGTRGQGDVLAAQQGAAWLARASGAAVLPVVFRGTRRPAGAGRRFRPRVDVLVGEPLPAPTGKGRADLAAATETIRVELAALVADLDDRRSSSDG
ncbi:MAG: 1-acyl-sn-glycerol-3-phosphate acyltransferase [Pseudonocardia sp.]|nr:1-acyl-sn-glycerol-3-phosphate acyltransferase [Pseudonocardia sp.]